MLFRKYLNSISTIYGSYKNCELADNQYIIKSISNLISLGYLYIKA